MFWWKNSDTDSLEDEEEEAYQAELEERREKTRSCILYVTYAFTLLFIVMIGYFGWFLQVRSQNVIGSSYNARLDRFSDRVVRGKILSADRQVLAETLVSADGTETRY